MTRESSREPWPAPLPSTSQRRLRVHSQRLGEGQGFRGRRDVDAAQQLVHDLHGLSVAGLRSDVGHRRREAVEHGTAAVQTAAGTKFGLVEVGLITAVPYAVATVAMLLWSRHSDRTGERIWHVALPAFVGATAVAVSLHLGSPLTTMIAITVTAVGIFCAVPVLWQLPSTFLVGTAAAAGIGFINSIGNLSGFAGAYLVGWLKDTTGSFQAGMLVVAGFMTLSGLLVLSLRRRAAAVPAQPVLVTD
ncbi:hypothetical protein [Saccharothrix deserti]|uniref:hypothetical protein n=1 Tax=Saccharothrix deserti TaxID=2593674 RepID=UPI001EE4CCED|nr:hypothetical protein [Saccharothrix deserti]